MTESPFKMACFYIKPAIYQNHLLIDNFHLKDIKKRAVWQFP
jgi:hypothetical protein